MDSAFSSNTPDCNDFSSDNQHLCIFSPVNHPNLNLSKEEMSDCRKGVYVAILTEVLIASCLYLLSGILHIFIASAIILCALTVILAKLLRQEIM